MAKQIHPVPDEFRGSGSFGRGKRDYPGHVLHNCNQRRCVGLVFNAQTRLHLLVGKLSWQNCGKFPRIHYRVPNLYRLILVQTESRGSSTRLLPKIRTNQGEGARGARGSRHWSSDQGPPYRTLRSSPSQVKGPNMARGGSIAYLKNLQTHWSTRLVNNKVKLFALALIGCLQAT